MKRTTISLSDDLAQVVEREAKRRETSISELTRTALAQYLGVDGESRRPLSFAGVGRSGHHNTARDADRVLAEGFGQDRSS